MKERASLKSMPLLSYSYSTKSDPKDERARKAQESYQLTTCAMSGLPLGYFPTRKISYATGIPFAQLNMADVRHCLHAAVQSETQSKERIFCFFALLAKIPKELLEIKSTSLRPQWSDVRVGAMLTNGGLRNLTAFVESILTLPERWYAEFPAHIVSRSMLHDNTNLQEFPSILARWVAICENTTRQIKTARHEQLSLRIFRRGQNAPSNPFAPTKTNTVEIAQYAKVLANFYGRQANLQWEAFVRNPSQVSSQKLRAVITSVIAHNVRECDDDFSDELALSQHFRRWLEEHLLRAEAQEENAAKMHRILRNDAKQVLAQMTEVNLQELIQKSEKMDEQSGLPQRKDYPSFDLYMDALSRWKKSFAGKQTPSVSPSPTPVK